MRFALVGFCVLFSCHDGESLQKLDENLTITTPGGTCGNWQETNGDPPTTTHVIAYCASGMNCMGSAYVFANPIDTMGRN
jgi:hypothetical protein